MAALDPPYDRVVCSGVDRLACSLLGFGSETEQFNMAGSARGALTQSLRVKADTNNGFVDQTRAGRFSVASGARQRRILDGVRPRLPHAISLGLIHEEGAIMPAGPFAGLLVVDLMRVLAGPFCTLV